MTGVSAGNGHRLGTLEAVAAAGYCIDEWERWCQGECMTYAVALMRMQVRLRFGTVGELYGPLENIEQDGWFPHHHFAHDDHWVYDSSGMHWRASYAGVQANFDYVEFDGEWTDWDPPDEDLITDAQDHARRNRILDGGYGSIAIVVVTSHRARRTLDRLLGHHDPGYYNADALMRDGNDYHIVPRELLNEVLAIKGIRLRKQPVNLAQRWSML